MSVLLVAAAAVAAIPASYQGQWARQGGHCTAGLQMEGILTIQPRHIAHGEVQMAVSGLRKATRMSIAVDSRNTADEQDYWTTTTVLTLSNRGRRLLLEETRRNGALVARRVPEFYNRCP